MTFPPNEKHHGEPKAVDARTWYVDECCTLPGLDIRDVVEAIGAHRSTTVRRLQVRQHAPRAFTGRGEESGPDA